MGDTSGRSGCVGLFAALLRKRERATERRSPAQLIGNWTLIIYYRLYIAFCGTSVAQFFYDFQISPAGGGYASRTDVFPFAPFLLLQFYLTYDVYICFVMFSYIPRFREKLVLFFLRIRFGRSAIRDGVGWGGGFYLQFSRDTRRGRRSGNSSTRVETSINVGNFVSLNIPFFFLFSSSFRSSRNDIPPANSPRLATRRSSPKRSLHNVRS